MRRRGALLPWRSRPFRHDGDGAIGVEFALVLPVLLLFLLGIVQFGSAYFLQNTMLNTARELARRLATDQVTVADAEAWARDRLPTVSRNFAVDVTPPQPGVTDGNVFRVVIRLPLSDAVMVDPLGLFRSGQLRAEVIAGVQE